MDSASEIILRYSGKDVDNGTMSLSDLIAGLEGLSGAYNKIADKKDLKDKVELRVTAIKKGSFEVIMQAWTWIGQNNTQLSALGSAASGFTSILALIISVIALTRHTEKQSYTDKINLSKGEVSITNSKNVTQNFSIEVFNIFRENTIATELSKIVKPLAEDKIDKAELIVRDASQTEVTQIIAEEKPYFEYAQDKITKEVEAKLKGTFNSLTKTTNKGIFILEDGRRVSYEFINEDPTKMYSDFAYNGIVEVHCIANFDINLNITSIKIIEVRKLQQELL